jgi:hypothetical protein
MSADASVTLTWADGEHKFRLAIGQLRELQEKTDAGPVEVLDRLATRRWRLDDVRETLRLGLIGGGMAPVKALGLVKRYVDERPLMESLPAAQAVLLAAIVGVPEDEVGKGEAEETTTSGSASRPFTAPEPQSDLAHPPSMQ